MNSWLRLARHYSTRPSSRVGLWGACFDQGQLRPGTGEAPRLLREAGMVETLTQHGLEVMDFGDEVLGREEEDTVQTRQVAVARSVESCKIM